MHDRGLRSHQTRRGGFAALACGGLLASSLSGAAQCQELLWEWSGDNVLWNLASDFYGNSVSFLGDVDGDGVPDAVVAAVLEDQSYSVEIGSVYVVSGATGMEIREHFGPQDRCLFGRMVVGGADFSGDGVPDYFVGAPDFDGAAGFDTGGVFVYSGADGALIYALEGEAQSDVFGISIALLGDLDGDGTQEFGVAAAGFDDGPSKTLAGRAYVYSGANGSVLYTVTGQSVDQILGRICGLGDLTGDGRREIGLGSYGINAGANNEGQFDVVDGVSGTILYTLYGEKRGDAFADGAGLGDVDGDGVEDFMVNATQFTIDPTSGSDTEGRIYVYSGATAALLYHYDGVQKSEHMGSLPIAGRIDFNHDGHADILVGSADRNWTKLGKGALFVYSGPTGRLLDRFSRFLDEPISGGCGASLSAVGDMNFDGIDDVIVGAPFTPTGKSSGAGRAYVFAGNDLFLQANAYHQIAGNPASLAVRGGTPGVLAALVLVDLNGTAAFTPVLVDLLDQYGELVLADTVPAGLSGLTMTFRAYAQKSSGRGLSDSIDEEIHFK